MSDSARPLSTDRQATSDDDDPRGDRLDVLADLVLELRAQRIAHEAADRQATAERRIDRRWRLLWQALFFGAPVLLGLLYFLYFLSSTGFRWGPFGDVVGVVRIEGEIGADQVASADHVIAALDTAFSKSNVKAVVLSIDSPGGSPVEAERIYAALATLRADHPKPVVAVISNLGASAAYMIALHADRIVAGKYSLVGSIGAIMSTFQLDRALARLDVTQRVYASGRLKSFLNPYTSPSAEVDAKAQRLIDEVGSAFVNGELRGRRGDKLASGVDFGTGEVWSGVEAKRLGLIDQVGTVDQVIATNWKLQAYDFGPSRATGGWLGGTLRNIVGDALRATAAEGPRLR